MKPPKRWGIEVWKKVLTGNIMRIRLTDKINSYAPAGLRDRFAPTCQWLGTVVVDDGRRGALMMTPEGNYLMVQSYNRTVPLTPARVAPALAEAMCKPDRVKRTPGRPAKYGERMQLVSVKLPAYMIEGATAQGEGNMALGVRNLIDEGMRALGHTVPDER